MFTRFLRTFSSGPGKDYYKILGIDVKSSKADIRSAYLKLVKIHHPDSQSGNEEKFKELGEAWSVLGNEKSRAEYDNVRSSGGSRPWDSYGFQNTDGYGSGSGRSKKNGFDSEEWQQQFKTGSKGPYGKSPFETQWDELFRQAQQKTKSTQESQSTKGRTKRTEYYEYFDPRTGRRVIYSFTTNKSGKKEADKNNTGSIFDEFLKDKFKNKDKDWDDKSDREQSIGIFDILTASAILFSTIMLFSLIADVLRRSRQIKNHNPDEMYMRQRPEEYVWDDFAREMHKRSRRER